jgi:predicted HAD superfamily Cof-like phosphohydrolase
MSLFEDLNDFHEKYGVPRRTTVGLLNKSTQQFRRNFLQEELDEYVIAVAQENLEEQIDALLDLVYIAVGTLDIMGVHGQAHWDEIQRANMSKIRANDASQSKRGSSLDVIKPEGWKGPDHQKILGAYYDYDI